MFLHNSEYILPSITKSEQWQGRGNFGRYRFEPRFLRTPAPFATNRNNRGYKKRFSDKICWAIDQSTNSFGITFLKIDFIRELLRDL